MWRIRSFLNTDAPHLAKIWNDHHSASQLHSRASVNLWDQCVLSKIYFQAEHLLLAVDEHDRAVGLVHYGPGMQGSMWVSTSTHTQLPASSSQGLIHALCVIPCEDEERIANQLILHAVGAMNQLGHSTCVAVGSHASSIFYLGIADGDNIMGVLDSDTRTHGWLAKAGFQREHSTECWELSLDAFRPPMDRMQISIRRSCSIGRILEESHPNWWVSTVLGHCDQSRFNLVAHGPQRTEMEILFWYPDATIRGVDPVTARLCVPPIGPDETQRERLVCLIAESARQLQQERKRVIRMVIAAEQSDMHPLLARLGFRLVGRGHEMRHQAAHVD